jgi:hypothetical protein
MNSTAYSEITANKSVSAKAAKAVILLVISLGLLWFTTDFSFFRIFESQSTGWVLWVSYAKDLILPFAFYFFLCLAERWLKTWQVRALIAFAIPTLIEIFQGLYYQFTPTRYVGSFDLLDILVYAVGVGLAIFIERKIFAKLLKFW